MRSRVTLARIEAAPMHDAQRIAVDDGFVAALHRQARERRAQIAVDLHVAGMNPQADQRAPHREVRGLQDVQAIDFFDIGPRHRPGERARRES